MRLGDWFDDNRFEKVNDYRRRNKRLLHRENYQR